MFINKSENLKIEIEKQDGSENTLYPMNLSLARTINECA